MCSRARGARAKVHKLQGAPGRIRTCDARLRSPALYPLSYEGGDRNQEWRQFRAPESRLQRSS